MVGVFGGTFDPIHVGHLQTVSAVQAQLALHRILIVPAYIPPHRPPPITTPEHRLSMVRLAVEEMPVLECDDREIRRGGISYTVLTMLELRQELAEKPLCLIVGLDSFLDFPRWHRWTEILESAHIVVMHRPGWDLPSPPPDWWRDAAQDNPDLLHQQPGGCIYCASVPAIDLNSTEIRKRLAGTSHVRESLPLSVLDYIRTHRLYE
jgi:nicotinate-nucleotide adenylyltransferase